MGYIGEEESQQEIIFDPLDEPSVIPAVPQVPLPARPAQPVPA
jgi:hypothetical protein